MQTQNTQRHTLSPHLPRAAPHTPRRTHRVRKRNHAGAAHSCRQAEDTSTEVHQRLHQRLQPVRLGAQHSPAYPHYYPQTNTPQSGSKHLRLSLHAYTSDGACLMPMSPRPHRTRGSLSFLCENPAKTVPPAPGRTPPLAPAMKYNFLLHPQPPACRREPFWHAWSPCIPCRVRVCRGACRACVVNPCPAGHLRRATAAQRRLKKNKLSNRVDNAKFMGSTSRAGRSMPSTWCTQWQRHDHTQPRQQPFTPIKHQSYHVRRIATPSTCIVPLHEINSAGAGGASPRLPVVLYRALYYAMARGATPSPQGHHHRGISTGCRVPPALGFCARSMRSTHRARSTAAARRPRATAESPRSAALPRNNNSPSTAPYPPRSSRAMPPPSSPGCRGTADQAPDACAARISAATAAPCRQMA